MDPDRETYFNYIIDLLIITVTSFMHTHCIPFCSNLGSISRRICADRFELIDIFLYGEDHESFRLGFFLFLFVTVYFLPLVIIIFTCSRIVISLLQTPSHLVEDTYTRAGLQCNKRRENRRKVSTCRIGQDDKM